MPTVSPDGQSVSFEFDEIFPGSKETGTITGHGDTVTVGDTVEVLFHEPSHLPQPVQHPEDVLVITGIDARPEGTTVYAKKPDEMAFLPASFAIGQKNGAWWRTFKKVG